jgi:hypothetical protein
MLEICDEVVEVDTPSGPPVFVNRWMKTQAISWVSDACLLLDTDTLIRKPLDDLPNLVEHLGAAPNYNTDNPSEQIWEEDLEELRRMDWPVEFAFYANGGALFFKQTSLVKHFFGFWHSFYLESVASLSRNRDQPSLNSAITASSVPVKRLPDTYNFQLRHIIKGWSEAVVWHYYMSVGSSATRFQRIVEQAPKLSWPELTNAIRCAVGASHPFFASDDLAIEIAELGNEVGSLSATARHWLTAENNHQRLDLLKQLDTMRDDSERLQREVNELRATLTSIYHSWSWKLTRPLRIFDRVLRTLFKKNISKGSGLLKPLLQPPTTMLTICNSSSLQNNITLEKKQNKQ